MKKPILPLNWLSMNSYLSRTVSPSLLNWLKDPGSLTWRLKKHSQTFRVQRLSESWERPRYDEQMRLQLMGNERVWAREVFLICDEQPAIYARSIIPATTIKGKGHVLKKLKNRPLIELLSQDVQLERSEIEITRLSNGTYGRRSVFSFYNKPVLVSEFFLPHGMFHSSNKRIDD